ncbi:MAG TPA: UDP-3-O-(3-hydroxymyristoyl)glucosamine N-acyltransferase [Kiritimatiellia bacterium]|nr:UDP-3-O-(3-hydroxymyristoyl)glucosamine N-acyltransferase [Kiritimatiellia bacterium]
MTSLRVDEIAAELQAEFTGDGSVSITGVAGIRYAKAGDLAYVSQLRYAADAEKTSASALIVGKDWIKPLPIPVIKVDKPEAAFTRIAIKLAPSPIEYLPGVHPTAVISPDAVLGKDVHVGPYCVIGRDVEIGDRTVLVGQNFIADGVTIGVDGLLYPQVTIREHVRIGDRVILHNGVVIGSDGFGYEADARGVRTKVPQIGIVQIGNDVEMGSNSTVDRARFGKTIIGNGVKIDNLVQIAHNVTIGDHVVIVAQVGVAGSALIGKHCILAGQVGIAGHVKIGDGVVVAAQSGVTKDIPSKSMVMGFPATPVKEFGVNQANLNRIPHLKKRVAELEARIKALEEKA